MTDPEYSIAICSYNMEKTVEESVESIVSQVEDDNRFEVVVIDDSTDNTTDILQDMEDEWESLRVIHDGSNKNLAEARNKSFEESDGAHILESLDVDDKYYECIKDFVTIYEQLRSQLDFDFFFSAQGMNIAPRSLLLDYPYYSLGYGEDRELWRRLINDGKYIGILNGQLAENIGYNRGFKQKLSVGFEVVVVQFQTGITLQSYLKWVLSGLIFGDDTKERYRLLFHLVVSPFAYIIAKNKPQYDSPINDIRVARNKLYENTMTLTDIEERYGVTINRDELSATGLQVFDIDKGNLPI